MNLTEWELALKPIVNALDHLQSVEDANNIMLERQALAMERMAKACETLARIAERQAPTSDDPSMVDPFQPTKAE